MTWIRRACWWTAASAGLRHGRRGLPATGSTCKVTVHDPVSGTASGTAMLGHHDALHLAIREAAITRLVARWLKVKHRLDGRLALVRCQLAQALEHLGVLHAQHRTIEFREPWGVVSHRTYLAWMVLGGLAEWAFNAAAFEKLDLSAEKAYTFAAGIALACQLAAHVIGSYLRQSYSPEHFHRRTIGMSWTAGAVMAIGLGAVTLLRATHLEATDGLQLVALGGMNACFLLAATVAAFASHDRENVHRICAQKRRVHTRVERLWKRWSRLAAEWDGARAKFQQAAIAQMDEWTATIREYRHYLSLSRKDSQDSTYLNEIVDSRFFRPRPEFGSELQPTPPPLADLIAAVTHPEAALPGSATGQSAPPARLTHAGESGAKHQNGHALASEEL